MDEKPKKALHVAYVFVSYPSLHKTFVDREIMILREMGVNVRIFSLHRSNLKLSAYQEAIKKSITYFTSLER